MKNIYSLKYEKILKDFIDNGIEKYRATQIFEWIHKKHIFDINEMSNIGKDLKDKIEKHYDMRTPKILEIYKSNIDETQKFLIELRDEEIIECVLLKYDYGYSICISSQVGCAMGCKFCASTIGGYVRNLTVDELLMQIYLVEKTNNISIRNIVIMGIGEPLLNIENIKDFLEIINCDIGRNISERNITISTCGIVDKIYDLSDRDSKFTLALSLHAPNDEIRKKIMPIAEKYSIDETMDAMSQYYINTKRRITFEYALIDGINASEKDAYELSKYLYKKLIKNNIDFNINLIPINEVPESGLDKPDKNMINRFKDILLENNINVTVRRELGKDISGSCGMLRRNRNIQSSSKN